MFMEPKGRKMIRIISWNIGKRHESWRHLDKLEADVALLQEAGALPKGIKTSPFLEPANLPYDRWPLVVQLSDKTKIDWFKPIGLLDKVTDGEIAISDPARLLSRVFRRLKANRS